MNFVTKLSAVHLHEKMVINQIVKFHSPKDKERCLRERAQLFIQKRQFTKPLENLTNPLIDGEILRGGGIHIIIYETNFSLTEYISFLFTSN